MPKASSPSWPFRVALPLEWKMTSSPPAPFITSLPSAAVSWSYWLVPVKVSACRVPVRTTRSIEIRVSVPPRPSASMTVPAVPTVDASKVTPEARPRSSQR